ncbi:MAG TPA: hypothetical protein VFE78_11925 [Gemmataceae bacterium]|nr:hypothetical protein [Gemmataceae bacterium]
MTATDPVPLAPLQAAFLALVLPKVVAHGRVYFRHLKAERKEDCIAEMVALAWKWHLRLAERGKDAARFPTAIATFAARAVRSGRRLAGMDRARDALSPLAQQRKGFAVGKLPDYSSLNGNAFDEALRDNTQTPPDQQCAFRIDFPAWRAGRTERDQRVLDDLMVGERTLEVAGRHGLSPGRVSQLRREFRTDWRRYCGDLPPSARATA